MNNFFHYVRATHVPSRVLAQVITGDAPDVPSGVDESRDWRRCDSHANKTKTGFIAVRFVLRGLS